MKFLRLDAFSSVLAKTSAQTSGLGFDQDFVLVLLGQQVRKVTHNLGGIIEKSIVSCIMKSRLICFHCLASKFKLYYTAATILIYHSWDIDIELASSYARITIIISAFPIIS